MARVFCWCAARSLHSVSCTAPWVQSPGVESGRVGAVGSPGTNVEVQKVAIGGVGGGNVQPSLDGYGTETEDPFTVFVTAYLMFCLNTSGCACDVLILMVWDETVSLSKNESTRE